MVCTTIGFAVVLVLPTLMSAKPVEISNYGAFFHSPGARKWSYTMVNHSPLKLILKFRTVIFYPNLNFLNFEHEEK